MLDYKIHLLILKFRICTTEVRLSEIPEKYPYYGFRYAGSVSFKKSDLTYKVTRYGFVNIYIRSRHAYYLKRCKYLVGTIINNLRPFCVNYEEKHCIVSLVNFQGTFNLPFLDLNFTQVCEVILQEFNNISARESRCSETPFIRYKSNGGKKLSEYFCVSCSFDDTNSVFDVKKTLGGSFVMTTAGDFIRFCQFFRSLYRCEDECEVETEI